ncbi:MAG: J domain-containing protein [Candidatus Limnocylindrales bacterium]
MPESSPERDPYKVLQVDPEADLDVIQAAYRRLAQKHHPDVAPETEGSNRMAELNAAWERLRDPVQRAAVDRERAERERLPREGERDGLLRHIDHADHGAGRTPPAPSPSSTPASPPAGPAGGGQAGGPKRRATDGTNRPPEEVSPDWTSGRSSVGGGYDPSSMRRAEGLGAAGPPPGDPAGSVLTFSRYAGWSLGEIARRDPDFLEWLDRTPIGRPYRDEIDALLRRLGRRRTADPARSDRHGLFRRR